MIIHATKPVRTVAPAVSPVTLAEAKAQVRVDDTASDTEIQAFIDTAVAHLDGIEGILGRCLVTQTWRQDWRAFPAGPLRLPFPDVSSVALAYTDEAGDPQTVDAATYHLIEDYYGPALFLAQGEHWPAIADRPDAVRATFVCGFGGAADVPAPIKAAIKMHVNSMYEYRGQGGAEDGRAAPPPWAYDSLIAPYRVFRL